MKFLESIFSWLAKHTTGEALIIVLISLLGGYNGATKDPKIKGWQRWINIIAGGLTASLSGLALFESGYPIWLTSFFSYLIGNVGHVLMNGLINFFREWEKRPVKFLQMIIALIRQLIVVLKEWYTRSQPPGTE